MLLSERLEAMDAGNTQANLTIWKATRPDEYRQWESRAKSMGNRDASEEEAAERIKKAGRRAAPDFTRSVDAAMTLVPDGWNGNVDWIGSRSSAVLNNTPFAKNAVIGTASTPAIALTAAALRSRGL